MALVISSSEQDAFAEMIWIIPGADLRRKDGRKKGGGKREEAGSGNVNALDGLAI